MPNKLFCQLVVLVLLSTPAYLLAGKLELAKIKLPPGFEISVYAEHVKNARQMALGDQGTLFVGSRREGKVYALVDSNHDGVIDKQMIIARGLAMPSGIACYKGDLWVGAVNRILRFPAIEKHLDHPQVEQVSDAFPDQTYHGWKYLSFGPDGWLYVPVGAPCNICDKAGFAEIRRLNIDTGEIQSMARGVRNSVGMAWHPQSGELWFTDNGRDMLGDDLPSDELNHLSKTGLHFGFPYCHQGDTPDPEFGRGHDCKNYQPPAYKLGAHVAALGMKFYTGDQFPADYKNRLFIAEHGSWNRSAKVGYRIVTLDIDKNGQTGNHQVFASGWLQGENAWGRPNDILVMPDGSILVSDDKAGVIYRIAYHSPGE